MRSMMRVLGGALLVSTALMVSGCGEKSAEEKVEDKAGEVEGKASEVEDKVEEAADTAAD